MYYTPVQSRKRCAWSAYGGLGIEYKWTERMGLYVEPSVSHYFDNNQPKSIHHSAYSIQNGSRYPIPDIINAAPLASAPFRGKYKIIQIGIICCQDGILLFPLFALIQEYQFFSYGHH